MTRAGQSREARTAPRPFSEPPVKTCGPASRLPGGPGAWPGPDRGIMQAFQRLAP